MRRLCYILPSLALLALGACSTADCDDNRNSLPLADFYSEGQRVMLSGLTVYGDGAPGDSLLLEDAQNVDELYLPFRITEGNTTFVLDFGGSSDEITFTYEPQPRFASSECGVVYDYKISNITHTSELIDSVTCPGGVITNAPGVNIHIYLKPQP
ncbi:MAG: hypothetical protein K2M14_02700 [Muribaculaceae bacterium]|nr:hypothetical protein [Muribaculaceae bacterium]